MLYYIFKITLELIVILFLSLIIMGVFFSDKLIFRPQKSSYIDNNNIIKLPVDKHVSISAMYLPAPEHTTNGYTILFSHGNSEDIGTATQFAKDLQSRGFAVMLYDYPGYGTSDGIPNEKNSYQSALAAYDYLVKNALAKPQNIIAYGHSLGGALAIYIATQREIAGVFIESAFISTFRVLTVYPILPFDKFNNIKRIKKITVPTIFVHGKLDNVVPFWHGQLLYESSNAPKEYLWLEHANHMIVKILVANNIGINGIVSYTYSPKKTL